MIYPSPVPATIAVHLDTHRNSPAALYIHPGAHTCGTARQNALSHSPHGLVLVTRSKRRTSESSPYITAGAGGGDNHLNIKHSSDSSERRVVRVPRKRHFEVSSAASVSLVLATAKRLRQQVHIFSPKRCGVCREATVVLRTVLLCWTATLRNPNPDHCLQFADLINLINNTNNTTCSQISLSCVACYSKNGAPMLRTAGYRLLPQHSGRLHAGMSSQSTA